ncbi:hypothetical protein N473_15665 [Pseudoalteromonas luteoviolacea CPMOR-1]|uniref:Uncharacterized protein n=1 Tax=Pseudoalteromonas luteoviolacea CPMOR-1 TaxID=1365248 RepID=A0A167LAQ4_9GAMM|nr:hypothetical protein [Pseudoalteromonas luteoviolacea]KZN64203.1 hypothetical protein N473_15665 [Pseudoalteromonas luteoviolacea CPMOR-1]
MKSYEKDQKEFVAEVKAILGCDYSMALVEARKAKNDYLLGITEPTARDLNQAKAAGNRVLLQHAKLHGVPSVTQQIKDKKQAEADRRNRPKAQKERFKSLKIANDVAANAGNFKHSKKVPQSQGFSLNDSLEQTYQQTAKQRA